MLSTAGAALAAATPSSAGVSQTVAIVAIAAGFLGTVVLFLNTSRMIKAEKARQEKALEEERKRLDATLDAERARWRREAIREILNDGAVLLTGFEEGMQQTIEEGARIPAPDAAAALKASGADELMNKISAFLARLRLWFPDEDEVVEAYRGPAKVSPKPAIAPT